MNKISISESEWMVMEILWGESPLSAREVFDRMPEARLDYRTVRTLLTRLQEKGAIERVDSHGLWVFHPAVDRRSALREKSRSFLQSFFGGHSELGIAHLIEDEKLSEETIEKLHQLLETKKKRLKK